MKRAKPKAKVQPRAVVAEDYIELTRGRGVQPEVIGATERISVNLANVAYLNALENNPSGACAVVLLNGTAILVTQSLDEIMGMLP